MIGHSLSMQCPILERISCPAADMSAPQHLNRVCPCNRGTLRTKQRSRLTVYWPGIDNDVDNNASALTTVLRVFCRTAVPDLFWSDGGSQFTSKKF